jgi:hypothetical protein
MNLFISSKILYKVYFRSLNRPPSGKMMKDVRDKYVFNKKSPEVLDPEVFCLLYFYSVYQIFPRFSFDFKKITHVPAFFSVM